MRRSTFTYLVLYEFCDFLQILQQLLLSLRRLLPAWVERRGSAVAAERRPEHLLILEQSGPVEMQLRVTGGSSVHFLLQMWKRGVKYQYSSSVSADLLILTNVSNAQYSQIVRRHLELVETTVDSVRR